MKRCLSFLPIVSVVLSFLAAWGLVALVFVHLAGSGGVQFIIRTLLIPALVVLLGRWNWWPAPLFRKSFTMPAPEAPTDQTEPMLQIGPVFGKERS